MEHHPDGSSFTVGRILRWIPGELLHLSWRLPNFAPNESTEVIVTFAAGKLWMETLTAFRNHLSGGDR